MNEQNLTPEFNPTLTIVFSARELLIFKNFIEKQKSLTKYNLEEDTDEMLKLYVKDKEKKHVEYLDELTEKIMEHKRLLKVLEFTNETIEYKYKI